MQAVRNGLTQHGLMGFNTDPHPFKVEPPLASETDHMGISVKLSSQFPSSLPQTIFLFVLTQGPSGVSATATVMPRLLTVSFLMLG